MQRFTASCNIYSSLANAVDLAAILNDCNDAEKQIFNVGALSINVAVLSQYIYSCCMFIELLHGAITY
jgi:hypothetical protein